MVRKNEHPLLPFFYYVNLLVICMCSEHPAVLFCTAIGGILWLSFLVERNALLKSLCFYALMILTITMTNPLFSHKGATVLFFLNGNAITKEAISYGFFMGVKMISVFAYSRCFSEVFKISQFLYLFGKASPKLALLLSMALAFVPKLKRQAKNVAAVQKTMGMYGTASVTDRMLSGIRVFDSLVTWSLEQGVLTADSMNARGYGEGKRTSFSIYRLQKKDKRMLLLMTAVFGAVYTAWANGSYAYSFYPKAGEVVWSVSQSISYSMVAAAAMLPVCIEIKEKIKWTVLESRI